jgi:hypothetical protein
MPFEPILVDVTPSGINYRFDERDIEAVRNALSREIAARKAAARKRKWRENLGPNECQRCGRKKETGRLELVNCAQCGAEVSRSYGR